MPESLVDDVCRKIATAMLFNYGLRPDDIPKLRAHIDFSDGTSVESGPAYGVSDVDVHGERTFLKVRFPEISTVGKTGEAKCYFQLGESVLKFWQGGLFLVRDHYSVNPELVLWLSDVRSSGVA